MDVVEVQVDVRLSVSNNAAQEACDILTYMAAHCAEVGLRQVAAHFDMHPNTLGRMVLDACDLTFGEALLEMRMQLAWALAREGVKAGIAAPHCGYERVPRFREAFLRRWGVAFDEAVCKEPCETRGSGGAAGHGRHAMRVITLATTVRLAVPDSRDALASAMLEYVAAHCDDVTLRGLAERFGVHPNTASAIVRRASGKTFSQVVHEARMARAGEMLASGAVPVSQVARACGYENPASFYRAFRAASGHAPREHGAGETHACSLACGRKQHAFQS